MRKKSRSCNCCVIITKKGNNREENLGRISREIKKRNSRKTRYGMQQGYSLNGLDVQERAYINLPSSQEKWEVNRFN